MKLILICILTVMPLAVAAEGFPEAQSVEYCSAKYGFPREVRCVQDMKADWQEYTRLRERYGGNEFVSPAILHCESRHFPRWDRARMCAADQVTALLALVKISDTLDLSDWSDVGRTLQLKDCWDTNLEDLEAVRSCYRRTTNPSAP